MCNSIKNLIQHSKIEPSLQNALLNTASHTQNKVNRSGSIISNRKKSVDKPSQASNLNYRGSFINAMNSGSPSVSKNNNPEKLKQQIDSISPNEIINFPPPLPKTPPPPLNDLRDDLMTRKNGS